MFQWSKNKRINRTSTVLPSPFSKIIRNCVHIFSKINTEDNYFLIMLGFSSFIVFNGHSTSDSLNWMALDFKFKKSRVICKTTWIAEMIKSLDMKILQ